ncbi:MAG: hypothetical protein C4551_06610 [Bacillota bacterium]|jgi:hypothetical protein|nr:MAG: hypothetical protein C4551_06610 [Bacillota bacterium]
MTKADCEALKELRELDADIRRDSPPWWATWAPLLLAPVTALLFGTIWWTPLVIALYACCFGYAVARFFLTPHRVMVWWARCDGMDGPWFFDPESAYDFTRDYADFTLRELLLLKEGQSIERDDDSVTRCLIPVRSVLNPDGSWKEWEGW